MLRFCYMFFNFIFDVDAKINLSISSFHMKVVGLSSFQCRIQKFDKLFHMIGILHSYPNNQFENIQKTPDWNCNPYWLDFFHNFWQQHKEWNWIYTFGCLGLDASKFFNYVLQDHHWVLSKSKVLHTKEAQKMDKILVVSGSKHMQIFSHG